MPTIYRYETPLVVDQARYNQLINRAGYFTTPTKAQSKIGESMYGDPRLGKRLYNDLSPFNIPLPLGIPQHANSANFISRLTTSIQAQGCNVALGEYSPTVYFVDNGTPRADVTLEGYDGTTRIMRNVPIPSHAVVDPSDDAHMCILDMTRGIEYDFFGMAKTNGVWAATWGCVYPTTSSGFLPYGLSARATGAA